MYYTQVLQSEYDSHLFAGDIAIKGSQKMQCIASHPDGTVETRRDICECDMCSVGEFGECEYNDGETMMMKGLTMMELIAGRRRDGSGG